MKRWALLLCAIPSLAQKTPQKTHQLCAPCHGEQVADFQTHKHFAKDLSCDMCHGASAKHRAATGAAPPDRVAGPDEVPALCGGCHAAQHKEYSASKHAAAVMARSRVRAANCATCHGVHAARTAAQRRQQCARCHGTLAGSHPEAAMSTCNTCHDRHTMATKK